MTSKVFLAFLMLTYPLQGADRSMISIIPRPAKTRVGEGRFRLTPETAIMADKGVFGEAAIFNKQVAPALGFELRILNPDAANDRTNTISLSIGADKDFGPEGYVLLVLEDRVAITGSDSAGVFYGLQTLRQLLPSSVYSENPAGEVDWIIPQVKIEDRPRFQWRGLMQDNSRRFLPMEYLRQNIDRLAMHKMNVFHLHLTDDQGWRVEIKKHPKLTEVGGYFEEEYPEPDGFYSQEEIKELVQYAAERHVMLVPEIDIPGHSRAALKAYPALGCLERKTYKIYPFYNGPNLVNAVLCPGKERVYDVLDDVIEELVDLFPAPYIHMGGDEVRRPDWSKCEHCQARMKDEGIEDEKELQRYFSNRIVQMIEKRGRRAIGWDEILNPELDKDAVVMAWRGTDHGIEAARRGYDVVFTPNLYTYLTRATSIKTTYEYEPIPDDFTADEAARIIGLQGSAWSHKRKSNGDFLDRQIHPRMSAVAERAWSPKGRRDWEDFKARLEEHSDRLEAMGVPFHRYAVIKTVNPGLAGDKADFQPGDKVISFGGADVLAPQDLIEAVRLAGQGAIVPAVVLRGEKTIELKVENVDLGIVLDKDKFGFPFRPKKSR